MPNLIFLLPDQLRHDFLGCYGATFVPTPNIDRLANNGILYGNAYSAHPVCVPARASLMVGMHALRTGVLDNGQALRPDLEACGIQTWPQLLNEQGYYTAAIGKMHFYPWDVRLGFQYRTIAEDKRWLHIRDDYYHFLHARGLRRYHGNEHEGFHENRGAIINRLPWECAVDHFVGTEAVRFIHEHGAEGPFAMMVGFPGPHCPYDPNPEFLEGLDPAAMPEPAPDAGDTPIIRQQNIRGNLGAWNGVDYAVFTPEHKRKLRLHYAASVRQIDYEVGQILDAVRQAGLEEDTIIVFSSDHGDYLGDHNLIGKGQFYEASTHVPLIVCDPRRERAVCDELVALTDVTPTLVGLGGCTIPSYMDAVPLPGLGLARSPHEYLIGALAGAWMAYDGEWKLSKYGTGEVTLFHMTHDPLEQRNLIRDPGAREVYDRLDAVLTHEIMQGMQEAHFDRRVYIRDLSQDPWFGREGWHRPYPRRVQDR